MGLGGGTGAIFTLPSGIEFLLFSGLRNASAFAFAHWVRDGDSFAPSLGKVVAVGTDSCSAMGSQLVGLMGNKRIDLGVVASPILLSERAELPSTVVRTPRLS